MEITLTLVVDESEHIEPNNYYYATRYENGFAEITQCIDCKRTGLYEDQYPTSPCIKCGGVVKTIGSGIFKFKDHKWYLRTR